MLNAKYLYAEMGNAGRSELGSFKRCSNDKLGNLVVIVDDNKLQSDTLVKNVSDLGNLLERFKSTGWIGEECNGNDISSLEELTKT